MSKAMSRRNESQEIRQRLEELGRRPLAEEEPTSNILAELQEQEARNQRLLDELRRGPADARQPVNIRALRQAYLQNGGDDPAVWAQLAQMLAEAQATENQLRNPPKPTKVIKHVKKKKSNE